MSTHVSPANGQTSTHAQEPFLTRSSVGYIGLHSASERLQRGLADVGEVSPPGTSVQGFAEAQHAGISALVELGSHALPSQPLPANGLPSTETSVRVVDGFDIVPALPGTHESVQEDTQRFPGPIPSSKTTRRTIAVLCLTASIAALYGIGRTAWPLRLTSSGLMVGAQATAISVVGVRMLSYYHSFLLHSQRYRSREAVSTAELKRLNVPYLRLHVTTRGLPGSAEVILRGVRNVAALVAEDPNFYRDRLRLEICTESPEQARLLQEQFSQASMPITGLVLLVPENYRTPAGTQMKARSLHYMVEQRRLGWGRRPGKTFIVHYDEESVIEPAEMRKLLRCLATTDKMILEGPIYYPLEYTSTSILCRAMEANRPIGCFECRSVMESGMPLHLHGSNLVVEEQFENDIGWDMGNLDGQPFIAEDYVFGVLAFLKGGRRAFGWHGTVMLEQPPFSYRSAFKQRQRWITGVLQGQQMMVRMDKFWSLPRWMRLQMIWGTRFRIFSFAIGTPVGLTFFAYLLLVLIGILPSGLSGAPAPPLPLPLMVWLCLVGFMWLMSVFIGAWLNIAHTRLPRFVRGTEMGKALTLAPIAGMCESAAGLWAVLCWIAGRRRVSWQPTPKTKQADEQMDWSKA